jgi:CBS domain-containing protein
MARYGRDLDRHRMGLHDFAEQRGERRGGLDSRRGEPRSRYGRLGPADQTAGSIGGMRSDAGSSRWDRFPGEEGWFGQGYAGYADADLQRGRRGFGGAFEGRGGEGRPGFERGGRARHGSELDFEPDRHRSVQRSDAERVRARDIMTTDPECVTPQVSVVEVARRMRDLEVGIIPVVDDLERKRVRGVITDRDLAIRVLAEGMDVETRVSDVMTGQVETVNQNDSVHRVLEVMKREQVRRVPVTDREGRLVGVIAQADLAVSYAGLDPQREIEVEEAIERISEPARPRR